MPFPRVFPALLFLSAASAFLLPARVGEAARPMLGALLAPVAQQIGRAHV